MTLRHRSLNVMAGRVPAIRCSTSVAWMAWTRPAMTATGDDIIQQPLGSIQPMLPSLRRYTTFSSLVVVLRNISTG